MDRGPVALFGAIVAIGLGPAMWLGAQFGSIEVVPTRPPALVGEPNSAPDNLVGGAGAGASTGSDPVINGAPQSEVEPTTARPPSPTPSATSSSPAAAPTTSASTGPSPSSKPTTPPTEASTTPTTAPTGGPTGPTLAPSLPPSVDDPGAGDPVGPDASAADATGA